MKRFVIAAALAAATIPASCSRNEVEMPAPGSAGEECIELAHGMIRLGERLEDPYTVENMTRAFSALYPTKAASDYISTTDLYVRFLPKTEEEYDLLEGLGLQMIDHPVDFSILQEGDYYHDPSVPEDEFTWQYAVVPYDFEFPEGVEYEVIDKCYIAEHKVVTRASAGIDWSAVERQSFEMTGNGGLIAPATKSSEGPSGRIYIHDDKLEEDVGVAGVKVSCNVFVKFASAYTDEEGYYQMGTSFSNRPRYRIVFKNVKGFAMGFNLVIVPASFSTLGKGDPDGVDCYITKDSDRMLFCRSVVNNACYDYYCQCEAEKDRIRTPPANLRLWLFKNLSSSSAVMLQQGALVDGGLLAKFLGDYIDLLKMFLPDVTLGLRGKEDYASIYHTAIHECAHASHYMQVGNGFWDKYIKFVLSSFVTSGFITYGIGTEKNHGYCEVGEMWAYYIETVMFRERYAADITSFGADNWFFPQIFCYMDERGINRYRIFQALTSDIIDKDILQEKLLSMYPECKTIIKQAFDRYI